MRKSRVAAKRTEISILALDDDEIMTITLQSYFQSSGYHVDIENDPNKAVERIRNHHYDILLLDFLMSPICGDEVVKAIREFNTDLYIILLTGHKSLAPPIKTIRETPGKARFQLPQKSGILSHAFPSDSSAPGRPLPCRPRSPDNSLSASEPHCLFSRRRSGRNASVHIKRRFQTQKSGSFGS